MSTSMKQERNICVLLPNKDQLDITVGVGVFNGSSCPLDSHQQIITDA